jgi:hypothetical protein
MTCEGCIDRRRQYPELSNIDHDKHDQASLPHRSVMTLGSLFND